MPESKPVLFWTDTAKDSTRSLLEYLEECFSEKEVEKVVSQLQKFEKSVLLFPDLFPVIKKPEMIHQAVLSNCTSVFYRKRKNVIEVFLVSDNRYDYLELL